MRVEDPHLALSAVRGSGRVLMVEGASERAYLSALDRRIGDLSTRRRVFVSYAHELSHQVVALNGANNTGMVAVLDTINMLGRYGQIAPTLWTTPVAEANELLTAPLYKSDSAPRLPARVTSDFAGMAPGAWLRITKTAILAELEQLAGPRITVGLSDAMGPRLANVRAALMRLIGALLAMARRCEAEIRTLHRQRLHVLARIRRLPNMRTFVLVIIAVCRHYGHRSEPGDHASLLIRRHLVSMGSCPPI